MTKDIRKNIDATIKLNESLEEGPVGYIGNKLAKAGQRVASKFTYGGTKQKLKKNVDVRSDAEQLIKRWNTEFASRKMQRTPMNIIRFLAKDKDLKMSRDELKTAWNKTSQLTKNFGTYDEVVNQLKKQERQPGGHPAERRQQSQPPISTAYPESIEEAKVPATQPMSIDNLRNLLINAIHVKVEAEAEQKLGGLPGDEDKEQAKVDPTAPAEQQPMDPTTAGDIAATPGGPDQPEPKMTPQKVDIMKKAGARDMDNDGDYDWDDIAKTAVAQGKGEEALSSIMKAISPEKAALVKAVLKGEIR